LLKRSKTDDEIDQEEAADARAGAVLVINDDQDGCELIARLIESADLSAQRCYDLEEIPGRLDGGDYSAVVVDSDNCGITTAFRILDEIRQAGPGVRNIAVVILAATNTNRLFAFQSGVDGYVVRPVHADEFLDVMRLVLDRSPEQRIEYRREQLLGGAAAG
jgi:DNA-binding response OmpR family regulator